MEILFHLTLSHNVTFDVQALEKKVSASPVTFRHPYTSEITYIVCANSTMRDFVERQLQAHPKKSPVTDGFITLRPTFITVGQCSPQDVLEQMAMLLLPVLQSYTCTIVNEYLIDVTDRYRDHPERLFDPDWTPPDVEQAIEASEQQQRRLWQERTQAQDKTPD